MSYLHNYSAKSESELVSLPGADKVASLSKPEKDLLICRSVDYPNPTESQRISCEILYGDCHCL